MTATKPSYALPSEGGSLPPTKKRRIYADNDTECFLPSDGANYEPVTLASTAYADRMLELANEYADTASTRLYKEPVRLVCNFNLASVVHGPVVIDGIIPAVNDRILLTNQTNPAENRIVYCYISIPVGVGGGEFEFLAAFPAEVYSASCIVPVSEGTLYADTAWTLTTNDPISGITPLTWSKTSEIVTTGHSLRRTLESNTTLTIHETPTARLEHTIGGVLSQKYEAGKSTYYSPNGLQSAELSVSNENVTKMQGNGDMIIQQGTAGAYLNLKSNGRNQFTPKENYEYTLEIHTLSQVRNNFVQLRSANNAYTGIVFTEDQSQGNVGIYSSYGAPNDLNFFYLPEGGTGNIVGNAPFNVLNFMTMTPTLITSVPKFLAPTLNITGKTRFGDTNVPVEMLELYSGASNCFLKFDHLNTSQNSGIQFYEGAVLKSNITCDGINGDLSLYGYPSGRFITLSHQSATGSVKIVGHAGGGFQTIAQFNNADYSSVFPYKVRIGSTAVPVNHLDITSVTTGATARIQSPYATVKQVVLASDTTDVGLIRVNANDTMTIGTITNKNVTIMRENTAAIDIMGTYINITGKQLVTPTLLTTGISPGFFVSDGVSGNTFSYIGDLGDPFNDVYFDTVHQAQLSQAASNAPDFTINGSTGWMDLPCSLTTRSGGGGSIPSYTQISGPFWGYEFPGTGAQVAEVFCEFHIPHTYDMFHNTGMYFHVHVTTKDAAPTGNFHFAVDYAVAKSGSVINYASYGTAHIVGTINQQYKHVIAETTDMFMAGQLDVDALVVARFYRDPAYATDTMNAGSVYLLFADAHIQVNKFTTKNRVAPFYT